MKVVAWHNYTPLWKKIKAINKWLSIWKCKYKYVWTEVVDREAYRINKDLYDLLMYTCETDDRKKIRIKKFVLDK